MGVGKIVNLIVGRPLMNGARWYLFAGAICFLVMIIPTTVGGNMGAHAVRQGEIIGEFLIPVVIAIHYSRKFSNARQTPSPTATS
ncbi:hypothetical protein ATI61_103544 [Archangium gephyra]|uniref:Uncharacterized protein n=3 Tax=Archangium gephyra TaxID=48 RepID=A0ABX9K7P1_9BACT|nr:hypothetical protein ATI61_103544 [Archangium gephyra]